MHVPSVMLLGVASGLSVFGMAIVVPAMGSMADHFDADYATVQFVVSAYLFGLATAQPVSGYLCDRFGRRPIMLCGFALFTFASILCVVAPSLPLLILARFLQAVGVSVGTVSTRAILRDTRDGEKMAEAMSIIAAAMGVAPVVAPVVGGLIDSYASFRVSFVVTAVMGGIVFIAMHWRLTETLPKGSRHPSWRNLLSNYRVLLSSPQFVGNTLIFGFKQGAFFSFLAIGAPYFLSAYGMDAKSFGISWGLLAIAYVLGATLGAKLTPRIGTAAVMRMSILSSLIVGFMILTVGNLGTPGVFTLLSLMGLLMVFAGSGTPGAMAGAVRYYPGMAGTASGLSSAVGLVLGGSFTVISGTIYAGDFQPIGTLIFIATCASAASWLLASRPLAETA